MPSPFPGMDPFIEDQEWPDFHLEFISVLRQTLMDLVLPRYVVRVERRVYVEHFTEEGPRAIGPHAAILDRGRETAAPATDSDTADAVEPVVLTLPITETQREAYLVVRERESMEVVTVIEILSPANKRQGTDGRREYLTKRTEVLRSASHLVELDLLRGGARLPTMETLPPGDYYAFVSRSGRRPCVEVYAWPLQLRLPSIPIPLAEGDADVTLGLQSVLDTVYDRAGYEYSLDYSRPLDPPLADADAAWMKQLLEGIRG